MEYRRVFLAIPIPQNLKNQLELIGKSILIENWKPTLKENLHITVHFFGNMKIQEITTNIAKISGILENEKAFVLQTEKLIIKKAATMMVWLKIKESEEFSKISKLLKEQFQAKDMRINPHITVGRYREIKELPKLPEFENQYITVSQLELWQSPLQTERPGFYKTLATFDLK